MKDSRISKLIEQLNSYLDTDTDGSGPSVSPTSPPAAMDRPSIAANFDLSRESDFSKMSENELLLAHTLLHQFYITGNRELSKSDIIELHKEIRPHIKHMRFDSLDDKK